jgi:hypothetical protein
MAQKFYKVGPDVAIEASVLGLNSAAFAVADPVTIDANGLLIVATAGDKVLGFSVEAITMAADNQTVAKIKPKFIPANQAVLMQYTSDQACTQTDVGAYADLVGTTGAIQMNLAAGANGAFIVKGFDPEEDGTTTEVIVETAEPQSLAFAQA